MNAISLSRPYAIVFAVALIFIACAMILVPVADAAGRRKPAATGSVAVTVELPKTVGPPLVIVINAYRSGSFESLGTCTLSKVLTNPDGSQYVVGVLRGLPLKTELAVTVTTPVPKGLLSQPGFTHMIVFSEPYDPKNPSGTPLLLTAAAPTAKVTFYPGDLEVVPPLPPATGTPQAASPSPSPSAPSRSSPAPSPSSS